MRILIITQYIYPETFKSSDMAFELRHRGHTVDVLSGIPNYPEGVYFDGYGLFRRRIETVNGIRFFRCFQTPRGRKASGIGLSMNYMSFVFSATFWVLCFFAWEKKYDAIITHEPSPITQIIPAIVLSKIRRIPVYSWIMDIWPDSLVVHIGKSAGCYLTPVLSAITNWIYKNSEKILITSRGFSPYINRYADYSSKIEYFPNWGSDTTGSIEYPQGLPILPNGYKIMMAGNLGRAQDLESVVKCAESLRDIDELKWIIIGNGSMKEWLVNYVKSNNLSDKVYVLGHFPQNAMPYFFAQADAMLLTLAKVDQPFLEATVPARLQSYMSSGKPILAMAGAGSSQVITEANCGYATNSGDYQILANIIRTKVLSDRISFNKMGLNGKKYYDQHFSLKKCIDHLCQIIENTNKDFNN